MGFRLNGFRGFGLSSSFGFQVMGFGCWATICLGLRELGLGLR